MSHQRYATVTFVVDAKHAEDLVAAVIRDDEAEQHMHFFTVADGVSDLALAQGADPDSWEHIR